MENLSTLMQTKPWLVLFINHTAMLVLSIITMLVVSRGKLSRYGFKLAENVHLKQVILWGLGLGITSTLIATPLAGRESTVEGELSFLQTVVFIWLYASISEEVFARGLIQTSLSRWSKYGFTVLERRISLPVLLSALLFGLLHLVQSAMGAGSYQVLVTVLFAFVLGIVAGYYRERTGSLAPAILVHMFANVGGSFAGCLMGLFTMH
jgi:membrane protease YdiL (CAAX protease family)